MIRLLIAFAFAVAASTSALAAEESDGGDYGAAPTEASADAALSRRYTFSWLFADDDTMKPRGGTTKGPEIILSREASEAWDALQVEGIDDKERDRRAILAMAGAYRTTFDFIETVGFTADYTPSTPYQSWGTEYVYVVEDKPDFISLQHILVMSIQLEDGSMSEPMVIKHWRQDWTWEDRDLQEYAGFNAWKRKSLKRRDVQGSWSQAVFQVDDSPRYETWGRWTHEPGYSHWESETTYRPLPRREFSVRDDYQALVGVMRISITPTGWVMEEDALKTVLNADGTARETSPYLAREAGISRYEHIVDYDFSAGDAYWQRTGNFWAVVRDYWRGMYEETDGFALHKSVEGVPMFAALFQLAETHSGEGFNRDTVQSDLETALAPYVR
ncbi:MAG: DUF6607 family protein [Pseudomonadota bacterium]